MHPWRIAQRPARPAFQCGLVFPDRRVARPADRAERDAGLDLTAVAFDLYPAINNISYESLVVAWSLNVKLINKFPYLLFAAGVPFVVFFCVVAFGVHPIIHDALWWLQIAMILIPPFVSFLIAKQRLRARGLSYSATMGDAGEAIDRDRERQP